MDATTQLAFLIAELAARAATMERNAAELRAAIARLRGNAGKIGAVDIHRETRTAASRCGNIDTTSLWNDAIELVMLLGDEGRV